MADAPFRDRTLSAEEVRRAIERVAALAKVDVAAGMSGQRLTVQELERHVQELGLDGGLVRRALESLELTDAGPAASGGVVRQVAIDGELPQGDFEAIAEAIDAVMRVQGLTSGVGRKLVWTPGGRFSEPSVTVQARDGVTQIRFHESLANASQNAVASTVAGGLVGSVAGTFALLGGVAIAKALEIGAAQGAAVVLSAAGLAGLGSAFATFAGLRRAYAARRTSRAAFADAVVAHVAAAVRTRVARDVPRARVEDEPAPCEDAAPLERDAPPARGGAKRQT